MNSSPFKQRSCRLGECHYHDVSYKGNCSKHDKYFPFDLCCLHETCKKEGKNGPDKE